MTKKLIAVDTVTRLTYIGVSEDFETLKEYATIDTQKSDKCTDTEVLLYSLYTTSKKSQGPLVLERQNRVAIHDLTRFLEQK